MTDGTTAVVRDLSERNPDQQNGPDRNGELVSSSPAWLELKLVDGGPSIAAGTPLKVQAGQTIYVGHVETAEYAGQVQQLGVRVGHWLSCQEVAFIQKFWNQSPSD